MTKVTLNVRLPEATLKKLDTPMNKSARLEALLKEAKDRDSVVVSVAEGTPYTVLGAQLGRCLAARPFTEVVDTSLQATSFYVKEHLVEALRELSKRYRLSMNDLVGLLIETWWQART